MQFCFLKESGISRAEKKSSKSKQPSGMQSKCPFIMKCTKSQKRGYNETFCATPASWRCLLGTLGGPLERAPAQAYFPPNQDSELPPRKPPVEGAPSGARSRERLWEASGQLRGCWLGCSCRAAAEQGLQLPEQRVQEESEAVERSGAWAW